MRFTMIKRFLGLSVALLSACTTVQKTEAIENVPSKPSDTLQCFAISGGLAAKSKAKAFTASMNWQQKGANSYKIRLFGPLGGGALMIERQGGQVTLTESNKTRRANDAESLLAQQTGVKLPVQNLYYWVRGLKAPGQAQQNFTANHQLQSLQQNGYTVTYEEYTNIEGYTLPHHIKVVGPDVFAKLVIKRWYVC